MLDKYAQEQNDLDFLYKRLDEMKSNMHDRLSRVRLKNKCLTPQAFRERDAFATYYENRLSYLMNIEERLMFGKLIFDNGEKYYIGRTSIRDYNKNLILMDWRAPEASYFYQATVKNRKCIQARYHIATKNRKILSIEKEYLNISLCKESKFKANLTTIRSVNKTKTGIMSDAIETMHAEQDRIIRTSINSALIVQGAPGTGKTIVALHRAAYLLYTYRNMLENSGILILGPSNTFLNYIHNVLPSLGETSVVMGTLKDIYSKRNCTYKQEINAKVRIVKASLKMKTVLHRAVRNFKNLPKKDATFSINGFILKLTIDDFKRAMNSAESLRKPHNEAWVIFAKDLMHNLAKQLLQYNVNNGVAVNKNMYNIYFSDIRSSREVRIAINKSWLPCNAEYFLSNFFHKESLILEATKNIFAFKDAMNLKRDKKEDFTFDDIPLLDELNRLLGDLEKIKQKNNNHQDEYKQFSAYNLENAKMALINSDSEIYIDPKYIVDHLNSKTVSRRKIVTDSEQIFRHIIVDESQELSEMQWNMVFSRCPSKSVTIVGDICQTETPYGLHDWSKIFQFLTSIKYKVEQLSVNYRIPTKIINIANKVIQSSSLDVMQSTTIREGKHEVRYHKSKNLKESVLRIVNSNNTIFDSKTAIIAMENDALTILTKKSMTPQESKGLEFDAVIVVEPINMINAKISNLYVALTRCSQKLDIVYTKNLPIGF